MRARGTLPVTPVAAVPSDSPLLWRTAVLDHHDGLTWFPASGEPPSPVGAAGEVPDLLGPAERHRRVAGCGTTA